MSLGPAPCGGKRQFDELAASLRERANIVQTGLENVGLSCERLTTPQLINLYYQIYNPMTSNEQKLASLGEMGVKEYVL